MSIAYRIILLVILGVVGICSGWKLRGDHEKALQLDAQISMANEKQALQAAVDSLSLKLAEANTAQRGKDRVITKEVTQYAYITPVSSRCSLDGRWRLLHDASASGEPADAAKFSAGEAKSVTDATAIETVSGNYEQCRIWREQVIGWQTFWSLIEKD